MKNSRTELSPQSLTVEELFSALHSQPQGLSSQTASERLTIFGKNQLEDDKTNRLLIFFRQFKNLLIYVLFAAAGISILLKELGDFFLIIGIVLINSIVGFWQEAKAETALKALKKLTESKTRVFRDGQLRILFSSEIVPGDCVFLQEGDIVTADIRLIEGSSLMTDESSLTGESVPIGKNSQAIFPPDTPIYSIQNMIWTGTSIVRGQGKGIVAQTGKNTYFAKIAEKAKEASPPSPLSKAINVFAQKYVTSLICLFTIFLMFGYFFQQRSFIDLSYVLIAALVSVVPEGLPLVITLVIIVGAIALSKNKTLIRSLPATSTLGSATVIACDKTGTITEGKLIVKEWISQDLAELQMIAALCNDGYQGTGDPIDLALWRWVESADQLRNRYPRKWSYPFDAKTMLMAVVHEIDGQETLLIKGAFEALSKISSVDNEIEKSFQILLEKGYRVLAFGKGFWNGNTDHHAWKVKIIGLIGFLDPPKAGVLEAVTKAKEAYIHVMMLTGDHPKTARFIAQEVGIWEEGDTTLTGQEIDLLDDQELAKVLRRTTVLARALPEHKYRIVKTLQSNHEIVAVTGDGINDVPALNAADLGIAMGDGTEAAKAVSEMVITDNNFKIIVDAILQGRVIIDNLRKVLYYLVSTSCQEICLLALSLLAFYPLPMTAVQILWINLVTDGVQDKCFAFIKSEGDVMKQRPQKISQKFFDAPQIFRMIFFGGIVGSFIFTLYVFLKPSLPFQLTSAIIFTCTVTAQWANGIQAQKAAEPFFKNIRRSFSINPTIFIGISLGITLQAIALYALPKQFKVIPLRIEDWIYPAATFIFAFSVVETRKWVEYFFGKDRNKKRC